MDILILDGLMNETEEQCVPFIWRGAEEEVGEVDERNGKSGAWGGR